MKVRIHRGAVEIGGSCIEVESSGERILLDVGMPLAASDDSRPLVPVVDPASLRGIAISHPHQDHYGLLPWMPTGVPVALGTAARRILKAAAPFTKHPALNLDGPNFVDRQPVHLGPFRITPYLVDHSAYDAYALVIEADGKRLFYSGDMRMHGRKAQLMDKLMATGPKNVDVLLIEGTTLGRGNSDTPSLSEDDLEAALQDAFNKTAGLILVQTSPQNIDRMVTIYRACLKSGRSLVFDLYAASILEATGNPAIPQSHWNHINLAIPNRQRVQIKTNGWFDALSRHSANRLYLGKDIARNPGKYVLLFRNVWMSDLERADCLTGDSLIHSQWEGYLKDPSWKKVEDWRTRQGIPLHQIHTSGHASPKDLQRFANAISPKVLVPIHSANPQNFRTLCPN
ncbi:MAG: MBL fold metallo-hydrolase, partial [Proteobacteria bacterium]|nr:MBL fold metallo-hydrolase [Pseudomonadota bacterium]